MVRILEGARKYFVVLRVTRSKEKFNGCGKKQSYSMPSMRNSFHFFMSATYLDENPSCCKNSSMGSILAFCSCDSQETASLSSPIPTLFSWIMGVLWSSALVFRCSCYYQDDETWQNKQLGVSLHCFLARTTRYLVSKYCYEFIASWGCGSILHRKTWTKFLLLVTILNLS